MNKLTRRYDKLMIHCRMNEETLFFSHIFNRGKEYNEQVYRHSSVYNFSNFLIDVSERRRLGLQADLSPNNDELFRPKFRLQLEMQNTKTFSHIS